MNNNLASLGSIIKEKWATVSLNCLHLHNKLTGMPLTFLSDSDPFTQSSIWVQEAKCLVLPFPHLSISMASLLCPLLFLLIASPLIYDRTQEYCFQDLICISLTLSLSSPPPPPPSLHRSPPHLFSTVCSAAVRPCENTSKP